MENRELGIYIHIPFCQQKCYYCDFISYANKQELIEKYINALKIEIDNYFKNTELFQKYNITTIYIGGGTPSYIEEKNIAEIVKSLKEKLKHNKTNFDEIEITIEINPGTVNKEKLQAYKNLGIKRISIGLQSAQNQILKSIGRIHTYEQFLETYNIAKLVGFDNINVDLMIGLPNQSIQDIKNTLEKIIKLNPAHISVYSLIIEEGTVIEKLIKTNRLKLLDDSVERNMYWYVKNTLELNGYNHYEISNFAKKGKESKHNMNCWNQKEYIGLGVSAHSYLNGIRYSNCISLENYINNINKLHINGFYEILKNIGTKVNTDFTSNILQENQQNLIYNIEEIQNLEMKKNEYMLLGLRKLEGVKISEFKEKYLENPIYLYRTELAKLVEEKLIVIDGDYIRLTNKGLDFANFVWEKFV